MVGVIEQLRKIETRRVPQALDVGEPVEDRPEVIDGVFDIAVTGEHVGLDRVDHTIEPA